MMQQDEGLIKALGIEGLPDDQKIRILEHSAQLIEQRLMLRLLESLPDEKREELNTILATDDKTKLDEFIGIHAPNFPDWLMEEVEELRSELSELGQVTE